MFLLPMQVLYANIANVATVDIRSYVGDYKVVFTNKIENKIHDHFQNKKSHYLVDKVIWQKYKNLLPPKNKIASLYILEVSEENKTLDEVKKYISFLLENKIRKDHKIIVIGGGLTQDIGSFTAHILLRGISWIFIPTTLLSMADSCIGSKSGINVDKYKNQIGTFHPPLKIFVSPQFLLTLPKSEVFNGIGEIIKHGLIKGGKDYSYIMDNLEKISTNQKFAQSIITKSILIKKEIVEKDELEKNVRKLLNYGHTFGHALEGYSHHAIHHGIAVLIGIDMANFISMKKGILKEKQFLLIHENISRYVDFKGVNINDIDYYMDFLSKDKKVIDDKVAAILCRRIGKIEIIWMKLNNKLKSMIRDYVIFLHGERI